VDNRSILFGILIATVVLFVLIWILRVTDFVKLRQWVGFHARSKSRQRVRCWTLGWTKRSVLKLRLPDFLVRAREERSWFL